MDARAHRDAIPLLAKKAPFDSESKRRELLERLNAIPGVKLPQDSLDMRPAFDLSALANPEALRAFKQVIEWGLAQIK